MAAHRLHHAQRADAAGNKENDDAGDHREREQGQAYRLLRDEGRGTVERDESNGAAGHHILALMAMHPRTVGLGLTRRKDGHPSGEQERTEGGRNQGDDNVLLCHGIHSLQTQSVLTNFTKVY